MTPSSKVAPRRVRPRIVARAVLALALLVAGGVAADIAADAGVVVKPIALPTTDSGIPFAPAHGAAVGTPSAPDAWGGARIGNEATLSDRVVSYDIDATLDPRAHTVTGKERLTWRNRSKSEARSVYLHLYMNAFEGTGSTFFTEMRHANGAFRSGAETKPGEWGHIALRKVAQAGAPVNWSFVHPDGGPATDHTVVQLDLPAPVAAGASTTLDIDFLTQLPRVVARTGYFKTFHLVGQWFPKIGVLELPGERGATAPRWNVHEFHMDSEFYADFGNFDVRLSAPKDYTVGATGKLVGAPVEKDGLRTHHYVQGDVHDFAWTADNRSAAPLTAHWSGAGSPDVSVTVLYPPEYAASAAPAMKAAKDALRYFSNTLGPYPYETLTVVIPPYNAGEAGGMEYPTFFTAVSFADVKPDTLAASALDFVTIHEFGHGYFYGILASNEFEEPMLDEGLNDFWDNRMLRERGQDIHLATGWSRALGIAPSMKVFDLERHMTPRFDPADAPGQNAYDRLQGIGAVYTRTATTMHDLEAALGKDATERAFKAYYQRWKFRHPSVADLRQSLVESTGRRELVESMFAQQIYRATKIDDRIERFTSSEELPGPGTVQRQDVWIEEEQANVDKRIATIRADWAKAHPQATNTAAAFPFRTSVTVRRRGAPVRQTLRVRFADGSTEQVIWDDQENGHTYSWLKPVQAVSAEIDPDGQHYLDLSKLDDSRGLAADARASHRWSLDFAALVQVLLSLIATV